MRTVTSQLGPYQCKIYRFALGLRSNGTVNIMTAIHYDYEAAKHTFIHFSSCTAGTVHTIQNSDTQLHLYAWVLTVGLFESAYSE